MIKAEATSPIIIKRYLSKRNGTKEPFPDCNEILFCDDTRRAKQPKPVNEHIDTQIGKYFSAKIKPKKLNPISAPLIII